MVIEEVSAIQENLEIERTCRESAEALASKVQYVPPSLLILSQWHLLTMWSIVLLHKNKVGAII